MTQSSFDSEGYAKWRSTQPFSDEAIAVAIERYIDEQTNNGKTWRIDYWRRRADRVRLGYVSVKDISLALPYLVTLCGICGRVALYRYGAAGRCRQHKDDAPYFFVAKRANLEAKGAAIEANSRSQSLRNKSYSNFRQFLASKRSVKA